MFIDTHCHLDFPEFNPDRDAVIQRAKDEGIEFMLNIGSSLKGSQDALELAQKYAFIFATVGLHPHAADSFSPEVLNTLKTLAANKKVAAIGEIGLDYFKNYSRQENQKKAFLSLLEMAKDLGLSVVIHNRQAENDTLNILKEALPKRTVVHCFSAGEGFLRACLDLGFFISFTCNITYKKAENLRRMVKLTPLERLMLETDAPFLAPEALRGRRNEPAFVKFVAEEIARIKEISIEEVAQITSDNAKEFFNLE